MGILSQVKGLELKTAEGLSGETEGSWGLGRLGIVGEHVGLVGDHDLDTDESRKLERHMCAEGPVR